MTYEDMDKTTVIICPPGADTEWWDPPAEAEYKELIYQKDSSWVSMLVRLDLPEETVVYLLVASPSAE